MARDSQKEGQPLEDLERELTGWKDPPARLMQALKQNELELFAQPILAIGKPGGIAMAEVLVRLREEEEALLPPGMFLPVFEYCGMMHELDRWVARQTVARLARGMRVPCLSINISVQTLGDTEFVPLIAAELARANVSPSSLAFEISEEDMVARPGSAKEFAESARKIGCPLILDSFGRDAASLRPLRALRVNYVKIDGVIVRSLHTSQIARNKLKAIMEVAEVAQIRLIGECVETAEALAHLKAHGVPYAQGFGIRPPVPIDKLAKNKQRDVTLR